MRIIYESEQVIYMIMQYYV